MSEHILLLLLLLLQGLLSRPDWDAARLLPIAHVPGGSGNGLAHSCGLQDAATAAFCICKGVVSPMDVASVLQAPAAAGGSPRRMYSMLSTTVSAA
jgi:diacylglycerol kinase family enzyme